MAPGKPEPRALRSRIQRFGATFPGVVNFLALFDRFYRYFLVFLSFFCNRFHVSSLVPRVFFAACRRFRLTWRQVDGSSCKMEPEVTFARPQFSTFDERDEFHRELAALQPGSQRNRAGVARPTAESGSKVPAVTRRTDPGGRRRVGAASAEPH